MPASWGARDGTRLGYEVVGRGSRTITCLHSLALDGSWFLPLAAELGSDYRVILPDLRGHGTSDSGPLPLSLAQMADDVIALWDRLGVDSSVVVGISMGGMVAQALATTAPDRVEALVLIATAGSYDDGARTAALARAAAARRPGGIEQMTPVLLQRWFGAEPSELVDRARGELSSADPEVHASCLESMTQVGSIDLDGVTAPTLVLGGRDDLSTPRPVVEALADAIPGAVLDMVPGAHLTAFTHPREVAERIRSFVGVPAATSPTPS
ncbi:alpha/beta fold hydrolase [Terrabacter sp. Ter38]|uniref:alpha/beta fold hydrolase n=1 Tax=Terrabacter sp. Ter38 TaxID=2926030 RepID=UPI002118A980|nr:alpha/beta fold hydrolase [Terrabacter sp. Ter38]